MTNIENTVDAFKFQLGETGVASLSDPRFQLVFGGRILNNGWWTLSSYGVADGCCLLAISSRTNPTTPVSQPQGSYGFDRLVESGFSEEEVQQFRSQFFA